MATAAIGLFLPELLVTGLSLGAAVTAFHYGGKALRWVDKNVFHPNVVRHLDIKNRKVHPNKYDTKGDQNQNLNHITGNVSQGRPQAVRKDIPQDERRFGLLGN